MLIEVKGNIVTDGYSFIVQQVNMMGVMGAGLAKQIRDKYPNVYFEYKRVLSDENVKLGDILYASTYDRAVNGKRCVCFFAQKGYGRDRRHTDYEAFQKCLDTLEHDMQFYGDKFTVAFPYGIGCGLAGGDWNVIRPMLEKFSEEVKQKVYLVRK